MQPSCFLSRSVRLDKAPAPDPAPSSPPAHRANGCAGLAVRFHSCSLRQGSLFRFFPCLQGSMAVHGGMGCGGCARLQERGEDGHPPARPRKLSITAASTKQTRPSRAHSESTALASRSTPSAEMRGQMKNWANLRGRRADSQLAVGSGQLDHLLGRRGWHEAREARPRSGALRSRGNTSQLLLQAQVMLHALGRRRTAPD